MKENHLKEVRYSWVLALVTAILLGIFIAAADCYFATLASVY